jgi:hypothetical protein
MDKNRETDGCGRDMPGEYREVSGRDRGAQGGTKKRCILARNITVTVRKY